MVSRIRSATTSPDTPVRPATVRIAAGGPDRFAKESFTNAADLSSPGGSGRMRASLLYSRHDAVVSDHPGVSWSLRAKLSTEP